MCGCLKKTPRVTLSPASLISHNSHFHKCTFPSQNNEYPIGTAMGYVPIPSHYATIAIAGNKVLYNVLTSCYMCYMLVV